MQQPTASLAALRDLAATTALTAADIAAAVEAAVVATYRRIVDDDPSVGARVDLERGHWHLYRHGDAGAEELLAVDVADFPRQAAAAVRIAVADRLAEVERRRVVDDATSQRAQLRDAVVRRRTGELWHLDASGTAAILPPEEQIPGESLELGRHLKVVVTDTRRRGSETILVVSRSHPMLVQRLMEQEVPELQTGQVIVRGIARDPGRRTKVAVDAPGGDIDAQGACIGQKGVRQRAVTSELGEEQVQIVAWSADPATFVKNALIPAVAIVVDLDRETKTAHVTVAADQLSLAIGRAGENARLAARLTAWRIDLRADGPEQP